MIVVTCYHIVGKKEYTIESILHSPTDNKVMRALLKTWLSERL